MDVHMAIIQLEFDDCCKPLNMNGLKGRMIYLPTSSRKTTEILVVYGQHSSLERWWGLLQYLHHYGNVTAPDLPGFGGMQSFYTIDQRPTLDNFADYLAAFIKLRYKRKRLVIIGMSFGFVVVTRMLQRYPELVKKVDVVTSLAGYMHYSDFRFTLNKLRRLRVISLVLSWRILAILFRHTCLTPFALRWALTRINPRQQILAVNTNDTDADSKRRN
jgi:pimeloyl-ACP methyl ester carboxylesterase